MEYVLSLSYGKDSCACLGAIEQLGWPLDRIVHAEVWATNTIPADPPQMVEFKSKADQIIRDRWGLEVEHIRHKKSYDEMFYHVMERGKHIGEIKGWPKTLGGWCKHLKMTDSLGGKGNVGYVGIAADEPKRFHNLNDMKRSPLVEAGWTEAICRDWCEQNNLLSPIYTSSLRGGCWFCHCQPTDQLRLLRTTYPEYWQMMLDWDKDSPVPFHPDGRTVRDYEMRFTLEEQGLIDPCKRFMWKHILHNQEPQPLSEAEELL